MDTAERVRDRIRWTVEILDPSPSDRLLEIGCGQGLAVSLLCPLLERGSVTAVDRSGAMVRQAARRNREHVDAGRARFAAVALKDAAFGAERFDKLFAINVRLFRDDAAADADALRRLLAPDATVYLFQQHPSARRTRAVTDELAQALEHHGFRVSAIESAGEGDALMTAIVGSD